MSSAVPAATTAAKATRATNWATNPLDTVPMGRLKP
jgi:hypothetical protein